MDSSVYIENNEDHLAKFRQCQFEMDCIQMMLYNSNTRTHGEQRIISDGVKNLLATEKLDTASNTVAQKYKNERKKAIDAINRTFDNFMKSKSCIRVKRSVV